MPKNKQFDIIGYGAVAVDDILYVDHYPESDAKVEVKHRVRQGGGLTGTALVTAARLGVKAAYFGSLGDNDSSDFTRSAFISENIDISTIIHIPDAKPITSTIIIDQSNCDRTIFYSLVDFDLLKSEDIRPEIFAAARYFMIDSYVLDKFPRLISLAQQFNTPIIADVETADVIKYPQELAAIPYLILNREHASLITGEEIPPKILDKLDSPQRICTVVTEGKEGCWFKVQSSGLFHLPAYHIEAIDTTGCGDVYHGAFAAALVHGKSITDAVKWGSGAAALKAQQPGGRKGIPNLPALLKFIDSHPENQPEVIQQ